MKEQIITKSVKENNPHILLDYLGMSKEELISAGLDGGVTACMLYHYRYRVIESIGCIGLNCDECPFLVKKTRNNAINFINQNNNKQMENKAPKLETGMLVQYTDGEIGFVSDNAIIQHDSIMEVSDYDSNLECKEADECTIVKVSEKLPIIRQCTCNWTEKTLNDNLLWERTPKSQQMTVREIEEELKKAGVLKGKLEIVKE